MTEGRAFQGFSKEAVTFLADLRAHNDRAWFNDHKAIYERAVKRPAAAFSDAMTAALEALTGTRHASRIYRIHRDVRFSKDKTPYNSHLHIAFIPSLDMPSPPCWFFGLDPDKLSLGVGSFAFDKPALETFRTRVGGAEGAVLDDLMRELRSQHVRFGEPALKRVPAGYAKDHPRADLLRHKGFSAWVDHPDPTIATTRDFIDRCMADCRRLKAVFDWLAP